MKCELELHDKSDCNKPYSCSECVHWVGRRKTTIDDLEWIEYERKRDRELKR